MVELTPKQELLNPYFDGYKLSSSHAAVTSLPLVYPAKDVPIQEHKYSFIDMQLYATKNHLVEDLWQLSSPVVYFINQRNQVCISKYNIDVIETQAVYDISATDNSKNYMHPSIKFCSPSLALLADGCGGLFLIQTGDRDPKKFYKWEKSHLVYQAKYPFMILTSLLNETDQSIHCVLLSAHERISEDSTGSYITIEWIQISGYENDISSCSVERVRTFLAKQPPLDCWFDTLLSGLFVVSNKSFLPVERDTHQPILSQTKNTPSDMCTDGVIKTYRWSQSNDLVSLSFDLPHDACIEDVLCQFGINHLNLHLKDGTTLLCGELEHPIVADASRWYVSDSKIEVALVKSVSGEFWHTVVLGDESGIHDIEGEEAEKLKQVSDNLQHLTSDKYEDGDTKAPNFNLEQLESCDMNMEDELRVMFLDASTGSSKTKFTLGTSQRLFSFCTGPGKPPCLCLRQDVDGTLWLPSEHVDGPMQHIATLDAFGYVHASKQELKFATCGRTFKFGVIADCLRNLYLYGQGENTSTHDQFVVRLCDTDRILGCQAFDSSAFVLTDTHIHHIKLPL